jgi:hypothetical protein
MLISLVTYLKKISVLTGDTSGISVFMIQSVFDESGFESRPIFLSNPPALKISRPSNIKFKFEKIFLWVIIAFLHPKH